MKIGDFVRVTVYPHLEGRVSKLDEKEVTIELNDRQSVITGIDGVELVEKNVATVNILGTVYRILKLEEGVDTKEDSADGWCDPYARTITVVLRKPDDKSTKDMDAYNRKVLRHEIIHAFLHESGIWCNSYSVDAWAMNEEMVDWMAVQMPKIYRAFEEAGCNE